MIETFFFCAGRRACAPHEILNHVTAAHLFFHKNHQITKQAAVAPDETT